MILIVCQNSIASRDSPPLTLFLLICVNDGTLRLVHSLERLLNLAWDFCDQAVLSIWLEGFSQATMFSQKVIK